jgi:hypothetical protein
MCTDVKNETLSQSNLPLMDDEARHHLSVLEPLPHSRGLDDRGASAGGVARSVSPQGTSRRQPAAAVNERHVA